MAVSRDSPPGFLVRGRGRPTLHPGNGFWIYAERRVVVEDRHAELWWEDSEAIATYLRVCQTLRESAVYGSDAHAVTNRARQSLTPTRTAG